MRLDATVKSPNLRFVIVHYHIFKNGGSTIESILEREFARKFATLHDENACGTLNGRQLASFLRQHPHVKAVSSHHVRYPKPVVRNMMVFDCCFLRHPLERLDSVYHYLRRIPPQDHWSRRARQTSARDFLRELARESPHMVHDVQVIQLACAGAFTRPAGGDDLERAAATFRDAAIPGLVEMFDESLVAAEYFLKPAFPEVTLEYVPKNVSRVRGPVAVGRPQNREQRLAEMWGSDLYEDLARLNQLDLELFRRAEDEIARRISLVPQAENRLGEFRARCARMRREEPAIQLVPVSRQMS